MVASNPLEANRKLLGNLLSGTRRKMGIIRPDFQAGKNPFRFFSFFHTVNRWDVIIGAYSEDDLGETFEILAKPVVRYFLGGRGGRMVNGISRSFDCPLFKEYCETPKEERNYRERPQDYFIVNAMDMRRVSDGIKPMVFKSSEWIGERDTSGDQKTYGVFNLVAGYPLNPVEDKPKEEKADEDDSPGGGGGLVAFAGYGWELLGFEGNDIIITKRKGKIGKNECLLLDKTITGGPVKRRPRVSKSTGEVLCLDIPRDKFESQITDLFWLDEAFPGWASDGRHLPYNEMDDMVKRFQIAATRFKEHGTVLGPTEIDDIDDVEHSDAGGTPADEQPAEPSAPVDDEDEAPFASFAQPGPNEDSADSNGTTPETASPSDDEDEAPGDPPSSTSPDTTTETPPASTAGSKGTRKGRKPRLAKGRKVTAVDKSMEDDVEVVTLFTGTVYEPPAEGQVKVTIKAGEQEDPRARQMASSAYATQKTQVFKFPVADVTPVE